MRVPSATVAALLTRSRVTRDDVNALAADAAPAARTQLVLDLLSLGERLEPAAVALARSLVQPREPASRADAVQDLHALGPALAADLVDTESAVAATFALASYAERLTALATEPDALEAGARALLEVAAKSAARGEPSRAEGDPWARAEWPAAGWRQLSELSRLGVVLEARGLRPPSFPRPTRPTSVDEPAWCRGCPPVFPLFRAPAADDIALGEGTLSRRALEAGLQTLADGPYGEPLIDVEEVARALEGA